IGRHAGKVVGYVTGRPGANAYHVGPCVADSAVGPKLLAAAWEQCAGQRVYIDVPDANEAAVAAVTAAGLSMQRPFARMCRGPRIEDRPGRIWACFGPEKG